LQRDWDVGVEQRPLPFAAYPLLIDQTVNFPLAPKSERVALVFATPFREKVIDRLTDQRRARPLLLFRQFVQLVELAIADINQYPHRRLRHS
jgi:hypothetical protein